MGQSKEAVDALDPKLREIFTMWDKDVDGTLSGAEYTAWSGARHYDLNKDGELQASEYASYHNPQAAAAKQAPAVQRLEASLRDIFTRWDADGDGVVSGKEYDNLGGGPRHYDANKDGVLTPQEYASYHYPGQQNRGKATSAGSPAGKYTCVGYGMNAGGGQGFVHKGWFSLLAGGRYSANGTSGKYQVNGSAIRFQGGAYDGVQGEVGSNGGKSQIVLIWVGPQTGYKSKQYCS